MFRQHRTRMQSEGTRSYLPTKLEGIIKVGLRGYSFSSFKKMPKLVLLQRLLSLVNKS